MIGKALENLGIKNYMLHGFPTNEEEFLQSFQKVVGEDENGTAIYSSDPKDFDVTWEQLKTELDRTLKEHDATEYRRNRAPEYPSIGDQLDDLYHSGFFSEEMRAKIQAVKDKYPKGS